MSTNYTPLEQIPIIRDELRATFRSGRTRSLEWRRHQLLQLARMAKENGDALAAAVNADLGRPKLETFLGEVGPIIERCMICADKLEEWTKPERVEVPDWMKLWNPTVYKAAKGTVLIIAPWNYPMILSLQPLYGAISAGCCAVIKLSELSPNYSALVAELLPKYLDSSAYRTILGAVPEVTKTLELQWDHIFYTGNGKVGRIIAAAAAKHLTPLTLELGGKSPVIIDRDFDLRLAAKRILWGKTTNCGQICVSPDYVLIPRDKQDKFIAAVKDAYAEFYPQGALNSDSFGRVVTETHFKRLLGLLEKTQGQIVFGGKNDGKKRIEPTIIRDVKPGDALLDEELFGPLLPLVPVDTLDEAIEYINTRDHALVLYAFTENEEVKKKINENTTSGNLVFNDTFMQLAVNELPFGGVGESGYGRQVLKFSCDLFMYQRSCVDIPRAAEPGLETRYPPYTQEKFEFFSAPARVEIPNSSAP
ncbi:hypothetical protein AMATHDRAFT_67022 [Amanita thiersii Skay4041]|uniref:Aldehyde dehydrogenase n=1 Tax=Amanita thiersii Skay4041 TaxID=703135 RepID=A0A2A9N9R6_9AGAR|nr:hypothetical protein AMATHDRAFT_67022 [Amanita thiersii Skay4041]